MLSFFNDTATTEIYTLSLHDALPICDSGNNVYGALDGGPVADGQWHHVAFVVDAAGGRLYLDGTTKDRKSTRLNSSHTVISYAVFCLKKKKTKKNRIKN